MQDVELLLSVFHPDMVWPWPSRYDAHNPADWQLVMGRFDVERWRAAYADLFAEWELVHNRRDTVKIELSEQGDGGFAVVDIDTLWRRQDNADEMRWNGRVCKVYALVDDGWKMTVHTGALIYPVEVSEVARRWVDVWSRAWPAADADAIAALYAPDAIFYSHPFRERQGPAEYVAWAFADQKEAECRFGEPLVSGDRAAVDWWAVIVSPDDSIETIAGTSLLRFDPDGLVVEQRDAWAGEPGRRELPHWAA
jgi:ketosteroid isomerase-like protein